MRPAAILPFLCLTLAAQTVVDAPIARVRLHPDEAWVTRIGQARVTGAGTAKFVIKDLPPGLGLDDLRVSAKGPEGSRLGDLGVSSEVRVVTETAEYKALLKEREGLRDRRDALEAEGESLQQELNFLRGLAAAYDKDISIKLAATAPNSASVVELSRGLGARQNEILGRERKRRRELEKLGEEEGRLQAELAKRSGGSREAPSRASIEITVPRTGDVELELSYRTRAARWVPAYEARLGADRKKLELVLFAAITQTSGEDWSGVKVEISNARASRSLAVPKYGGAQEAAWTVSPPPAPPPPPAPSMDGYASSQNTYVARTVEVVSAKLEEADEGEAATLEEAQGLATTFTLDGTKEVPADGEPHRFRVVAKELAPDLRLMAVPRLDPTVYQVARFATPSGIPLFPGAAIVQFAGTVRLGQTHLAMPTPGQPFELGFGPYRGVRVSYTRVDARKEQVGTFTKERQWTLKEKFEAANDTAEPVEVEVQDRILKSTVEQLKIAASPDTTPGEERSPGVRTWTLRLQPKEGATVQLGTVIKAPLEGVLTGLEGLRLPQ
ncbi:MAG: mucoidy inhibitor MuiA family protein [Holophagaceae bacterium]|nr:mucoidy inhibitor MuiA family protein [Holophagaceae bacterium]